MRFYMRYCYIFIYLIPFIIFDCYGKNINNKGETNNFMNKSNNTCFEIYCLFGVDSVENIDRIDSALFSEDPIINTHDIIEYIWDKHEIVLNPDAIQRIDSKINMKTLTGKWGIPFVVMVNRKPIYYGYFWTLLYSKSISLPCILIEDLKKRTIKINLFGNEGNDPRPNKIIFNCLQSNGVLNVGTIDN